MFRPNEVLRFAFRFLVFYGVLTVVWPVISSSYAACFRACGNQAFGSFGSHGAVLYRPLSTEGAGWDTEVLTKNRQRSGHMRMNCSSRYTGYVPTAMVVSLVLATPISWPRRWRALLWGIVLVQGFVALRMVIAVIWLFGSVSLFLFPQSWNGAVAIAHLVLTELPLTSWVFPSIIWMMVSFRSGDLMRILPSGATGRVKPA